MNSPKDLLEKLEARDFDTLIGLMESEWLDAKETPYHLETQKQKLELAKDVTAMANAAGGIIVLGFDCEKQPTTSGERICKVSQFPVSRIDPSKYDQILADLVQPPPHGVSVRVFERQDGRGVGAIVVDAAAMTEKPYIVGKMLDENDQSIGSYFGFFERRRDFTPPISIARIQQQLAAGLQWSSIHERLSSIEGKIDSWTAPPPKPSKFSGIEKADHDMRVKKARIAMGRDDSPIVYFAATAQGLCDFPTLFKSHAERVVRLIENPPQLRPQGFEVWADRTSEIVEGRFRRNVIAGHRLIELWKDGDFIFIAPGDEDFLGWRVGSSEGKPIHISNFVLAEATLVFCWLVRWVFAEANPKPPVVRLSVGFDNLSRPAGNATLGTVPEGRMRGFINQPKVARGPACEVYELAEWDDYDPERIAYKLVENIYHWFSFESDGIPYVDNSGPEPKLSAVTLVEKPLPTDPPETPGYA